MIAFPDEAIRPRLMERRILNIAHRGASAAYPENTLSAFAAAIKNGAQMCELDVHRTADGALVVIHDDTIDRTTNGIGDVASITAARLALFDAGLWRGSQFAGERVPTLEQVFRLVEGRCALNIELKADGVEEGVCNVVRAFNAESSTIVSSFDWQALRRVRRIAPEIRVGLLASRPPAKLLKAAIEMKASAVHPRFDLISRSFCDAAHQSSLLVYAWTVDDPITMRGLIRAGVDGIMTDYPARLRDVIEEDGAVRAR